ncbi:MAG: Uma2 family endonuclease [Armatimonadetes bacterium]|nr:Uma2 family endonuclease [Anaerolineae bacterium]
MRFCREDSLPCHLSGADGAYQIGEAVLVPDFAYKITPMSDDYPDPVPPLWVAEVISPTDKAVDLRLKRAIYRQAKILLWEIYPQSSSVDVYAPGEPLREFGIADTLDAGDLLPGFSLMVKYLLDS